MRTFTSTSQCPYHWHRIIVGAIAHQRHRSHLASNSLSQASYGAAGKGRPLKSTSCKYCAHAVGEANINWRSDIGGCAALPAATRISSIGAIVVAPLCPCRGADRREAARQRRRWRCRWRCETVPKLKSTVSDHLRSYFAAAYRSMLGCGLLRRSATASSVVSLSAGAAVILLCPHDLRAKAPSTARVR
jgi:hypothetical protein